MLTCPHCHQPFTLQAVVASRPPTTTSAPAFVPPLATGTPWTCPTHRQSKIVPAGISKKSGRPYGSFAACPVEGCGEKGPFGSAPSAPEPVTYGGAALDDLPF
jgi:predicted RNA-binding Zn-ribbon protein involved in translation (DUF1610 family)